MLFTIADRICLPYIPNNLPLSVYLRAPVSAPRLTALPSPQIHVGGVFRLKLFLEGFVALEPRSRRAVREHALDDLRRQANCRYNIVVVVVVVVELR